MIHAWIFFRDLYARLHTKREKLCPHCHGNLRVRAGERSGEATYYSIPEDDERVHEHAHETKQEYGRIQINDTEAGPSKSGDPRPSTDDETARLV
jgi:hypothetical protein